ncbi:MAG TPA: non-homologous end-joining DNA ligase [Rhodothermales bacterium]|nr:non-homologous end-joining DNA ligase [Rhodothermales bacterium]
MKQDDPLPANALDRQKLSGNLSVAVPGGVVDLTHLDKVYWPDSEHTKGDLIRYYHEVSATILPYLEQRPLILKRFPNGITKPSFFQHQAGEVPQFVGTARLESEEGRRIDYILCNDEATLLYVSNLGAIERHPWNARLESLDRPDWMVFDLDPGEGVPFGQICELATSVNTILTQLGLASYPKTSGSRGLHVYVPIANRYPFAQIAPLAARIAERVVDENPALATLERALESRKRGQIYVDHLQNAKGKSVVSPYSVRPRPGATVSTPLSWNEVESCPDPGSFTIETIPPRIRKLGDLFEPVLENKQDLKQALEQLDVV